MDRTLPPNMMVEQHHCGFSVGFVTIDGHKQYLDLDSKEEIEFCPKCEDYLDPKKAADARVKRGTTTLPS